MNTRSLLLGLLALLPLGTQAAPSSLAHPRSDDHITKEELRQGFRNGYILAKAKEGVSEDDLRNLETKHGIPSRRRLQLMPTLRVLTVPGDHSPDQSIQELAATGLYDYVERDYILKPLAVPNDPKYLDGSQWGLGRGTTSSGTAASHISAEAGWDVRTDASSVVVAVVDTGVRLDHEDLSSNLWTNTGEVADNGLDDDGDGYPDNIHGINTFATKGSAASGNPNDENGHGTAVASVIGASGNNGTGMTGVAWKAKLMAIRVADANGFASVSSEVAAFDYAASKGASIINFSFGGNSFSQASYDAIARCKDAGVIVCIAAGNDSNPNSFEPTFPGAYNLENIVTVAATDRDDALASFSNYGAGSVDLAAPGLDIEVADYLSNNGYRTMSGTSFAAPMTTGVLALVKAQFPGENYRATINRVLNSVDATTSLNGSVISGGRLNLQKALTSTSIEPSNDRSTRPVMVHETSELLKGCFLNATVEPDRPANLSSLDKPTLWWKWKSDYSSTAILDTDGSSADTIVNVYIANPDGSPQVAGTLLATNDDNGTKKTSHVTWTTSSGTSYLIAVSSKTGSTGLARVMLTYRPPNDNFNSAFGISTSGNDSNYGFNLGGTREASEPTLPPTNAAGTAAGSTVWYKWNCIKTGHYAFSIYTQGYDGTCAVYKGSSLSNLTKIASGSTDPDANEPAEFDATTNTTYYFGVDGIRSTYSPGGGYFAYSLSTVSHIAFTYGNVNSSPTYNPVNGALYSADEYGILFGINFPTTGTVMVQPSAYFAGTQLSGSVFFQSPTVALDGSLYIGDGNGHLYHLSAANLDILEKVDLPNTEVISNMALSVEGNVFVHTTDGYLRAFRPNLSELWKTEVPGESYSSPSIDDMGQLFIGSDNGFLYAIDTHDGSVLWKYDCGGPIVSSPVLTFSYVVVLTKTGRVVQLNYNGSLHSSNDTGHAARGSPVQTTNGFAFGTDAGLLVHVDETGHQDWTYSMGASSSVGTPAVDGSGKIYIGSFDGYLHVVSATGAPVTKYAVCRGTLGSPIIANNAVYFGGYDKRTYSISGGGLVPYSGWSMIGQNERHTGRKSSNVAPFFKYSLKPVTVSRKSPVVLKSHADGKENITYQWYHNGTEIPGATSAYFTIASAVDSDAGTYSVKATNSVGSSMSNEMQLSFPALPPAITGHPSSQTAPAGSALSLSVSTSASGATYQWYLNGSALAGQTGATLSLPNLQAGNAGDYTVTVTTSSGSTTSRPATVAVGTPVVGKLLNLSVRSVAGHDGSPLIVGFYMNGNKNLLVRGVGPTLSLFGLSDVMSDPTLKLYDSGSSLKASNNNWGDSGNAAALKDLFSLAGAFQLVDGSLDAALSATATGANSAIVESNTSGGTGTVLVEMYDTAGAQDGRLINLSARNYAGSGEATLIAGFYIDGTAPKKLLVRAVGPTLAAFGLSGVLQDPRLDLHRVTGGTDVLIASNDEWTDEPGVAAANSLAGAFNLNSGSLDAALIVTVPPGSYTANLSGVNGATGTALVEIYEIQE